MNPVVFVNGVSMSAGGYDVLSALIGSTFAEEKLSAQKDETLMEQLGITPTTPLSPDEKFNSMAGGTELEEVEESEDLPYLDIGTGPAKGFKIKMFGGVYKVSKLFMEWVSSAKTLEQADPSVKREWMNIARNITRLNYSKTKTKQMLFAKIFTLGWSIIAEFGPGSATPSGKALFAKNHTYLGGTKSFSNIVPNNPALTDVSLRTALGILGNDIRLENGDYIEKPDVYKLVVSREGELNAREILNNGYQFQWDQENKINIYTFDGFRIELEVVAALNYLDKNGNSIGSKEAWYLYNKDGARIANAIRYIELWPAKIEIYKNNSNKDNLVSIDMGCTVDHYGLEKFVVGSKGDGSV